jgi:two-component system, NarL family, nitrate/nitrite response regulator NarL
MEAGLDMQAPVAGCGDTIRVVIASDVLLYCEGLARVFRDGDRIALVATASRAADTLEHIRALAPDVVLLDMAMEEAITVARETPRISKRTRIVALGIPEVEADIISCAEIGIAGYVPRTGSVSDAFEAVHAAARGEVRCSPRIAGFLFRHIATLSGERSSSSPIAKLTAREAQILRLLQQGLSNKMISRRLGIEPPTVKNHIHTLLGKLGVHRRAEAVSLLSRKEQRDAP